MTDPKQLQADVLEARLRSYYADKCRHRVSVEYGPHYVMWHGEMFYFIPAETIEQDFVYISDQMCRVQS